MFRVAVCEDDILQSEIIVSLLNKYKAERPGINILTCTFSSASRVLESINSGQEYNLFLLDILLPEMNGIELARKIREKYNDTPLVFLTSSADYALDAYKVSASQYILKPVNQKELFPVLDNIMVTLKQKKERFCILTMNKNTVKIPFGSIVCIELVKRAMQFYLDDGNILHSNTIRISFAEAIASILEDGRFLYEHKSFVLNMEHVKEIRASSFIMKGGIVVPIPKYNFSKAKARYLEWINEQ